jgi:uncharacterized membrane protein
MYELVAVAFGGKHRASEVLEQLQTLNADWTINLHDAVAVYRTDAGRLRVDQSVQPTSGKGAALGGLLGGLLGAIIAAPFTAGASTVAAVSLIGAGIVGFGAPGAIAGAADAHDWKELYGVPDEFVQQIGGMLRPGESAIFAVFDTGRATIVAEQFRSYGGRVLQTSLAPRRPAEEGEAAEVERILKPDQTSA